MKIRINSGKKIGMDITPLLDMIFIVLIFFMIAATFDMNRSIKLKLPTSFAGESAISKDKILIEVDKEGIISINGDFVEINNLSSKLREIEEYNKSTVYLLGDKESSYKNIINIIDILKLTGISDISLVTEEKIEIE